MSRLNTVANAPADCECVVTMNVSCRVYQVYETRRKRYHKHMEDAAWPSSFILFFYLFRFMDALATRSAG